MQVNFYTLTFKKKILLSFIVILLNLVIIDIALYFVAQSKSTKTTYINDKFSKIRHFELNNPKNKKIVFVGSSRTFYQLSTNVFKNKGFDVYNFGVSGAQYEDYPTIIESLNKAKPKQIVISLSVNRFYNKLNISKYPTLKEISYYYNIDKIKFLESLKQWVVNRHLFLQYSEPIYYKLKSLYAKFDIHRSDLNEKEEKSKPTIGGYSYYSQLVDCNVFDIKQPSDTEVIVKCSNGDGVLIGSNPHIEKKQIQELKTLNLEAIKYINKLIQDIDKSIKVTVVLEPIFHNDYVYDLDKIEQKLKGVKIIDLTNFKIDDDYWLDHRHLNYKGREKYSKYLSNLL